MRRRPHPVVAIAAALLLPSVAAAVDCNVSVTGLNFGTYDPLVAVDDSVGSITVTCTGKPKQPVTTVNYVVTLSPGSSGSYAQRQMLTAAGALDYNAYADAARTSVLGNASSGTVVLTGSLRVGPGVGNGTRSNTHTVYGRIPGLQDAAAGTYTDTLVVMLTF